MKDISVADSSRLLDAPLREKAKDMQDEMNKTEDLQEQRLKILNDEVERIQT